MKTPLAILFSDLHLQSLPPPVRSSSVDWFEVQAHVCKQLRDWKEKLQVPVICAGDIFDRATSTNELVNFALRELPEMWAVPGQHDLPTHNYELIEKSSYGVLVNAGKIKPLEPGISHYFGDHLEVTGFPWGFPIEPPAPFSGIKLAVVHSYIWKTGRSYPGADKSERVGAYKKSLRGYDAALFGDNHKGFLVRSGTQSILNNGVMLVRKSDEVSYKPKIGILYSDGSIKRQRLDTSLDVFVEISKREETEAFEMQDFLAELNNLGESGLNYEEMVSRYLSDNKEETTEGTRKLILKSIGK